MVRKAARQDAESISRILFQVNAVHAEGRPDIFRAGGVKYDLQATKELIDDKKMQIFVFEDEDEKVLGYLISRFEETKEDTSRHYRKTLYIDDLCVDEASRGKHVGTALYEHVLAFARENGCDSVTLNVWECNTAARKFYERMGLLPLKTTMEKVL